MDAKFLNHIIDDIEPYLILPQTNPEKFDEFSNLLLKLMRILPTFSIHDQFNPLLVFKEKQDYTEAITRLQSFFFSNFQQNSLIKHYLTIAAKVFTHKFTYYTDNNNQQIIFSINLTRYLIWSWQKNLVTYLDLISYVFMIFQSISLIKHDYSCFYAREKFDLNEQLNLVSHYQILQQLFQTELEKNEKVEFLLRLIKCSDIAWHINLLKFDPECEKKFEKNVIQAYENLHIFSQFSMEKIKELKLDQMDIINDQYEDYDENSLLDLKTEYVTFCDIEKCERTMKFSRISLDLDIILICVQITSQCIVLLQDYLYKVTEIIYDQTGDVQNKIVSKFPFKNSVKDIQLQKIVQDKKFVSFAHLLFKPLMGNKYLSSETYIFAEMFLKLYQLKQIMKNRMIEQTVQITQKMVISKNYAYDLNQILFFGMTRFFDNVQLKNLNIIMQYSQIIYIKQVFKVNCMDDFEKFDDTQGIDNCEYSYSRNLVKLLSDQSSIGRVQDYVKMQYLNQMQSNFLKEREIKIIRYDLENYITLSIQELRIFSSNTFQLILQNENTIFLPFIINIQQLLESLFDFPNLLEQLTADEIAQIAVTFWFFHISSISWKIIYHFVQKRQLSSIYVKFICQILQDYRLYLDLTLQEEDQIDELRTQYL